MLKLLFNLWELHESWTKALLSHSHAHMHSTLNTKNKAKDLLLQLNGSLCDFMGRLVPAAIAIQLTLNTLFDSQKWILSP